MEAEKKRSKGGLLNLFDWNGKSRKKLFTNIPEELPGSQGLKQGKDDVENVLKPGILIDGDENEASSSNKGSGDWNSGSCLTSDDGSGTSRAPSVVARLMGLDSLPTTNVAEPSLSSGQFSDSCSLRSSHHDKADLRNDFYAMEYVNMHNRLEILSRNQELSRSQRVQSRPIERFQIEVLPPKSAKSIPITHHKLLSPIKNPGFVPTKNATYIMEAAAKIIEASPRASPKGKVSSIGTSSVPLRIRDLKEKMEAANKASRPEKPKEVGALKYARGRYSNKTHSGSEYVLITRPSMDPEKRNLNNNSNKGRSTSLSLQAKTNPQRRDGSTSYGNKNFVNRKEQKDVKSNLLSKLQPGLHRTEQKRTSLESSNNVLRPNNQKQNCVSNKDKLSGENSSSNLPARRTRSSGGSIEPNKAANKIVVISKNGLRKPASIATATQRDVPLSSAKNASSKKRVVSSDIHSEEASSSSSLIGDGERSIKCNVSMDSFSSMSPDRRKPGMDVISFTFNSPLKRSPSKSQSGGQVISVEKRNGVNSISDKDQLLYSNGFTLSSPGSNVLGADSLSALLEQKLLELTCKVQSYQSNRVREENSASCASESQDSNVVSTVSRGKQVQVSLLRDQSQTDSMNSYDSPPFDGPTNHKWQDREECSGSSNNTGKELEYDDLSPESSFELSFDSGSFADTRSCASGSKGCSFAESRNGISLSGGSEFLPEFSVIDSAESTPSSSTRNGSRKTVTRRFSLADLDGPSNWELAYVRTIISNAELALEDFSMGDVNEVITKNLFDHLENEDIGIDGYGEESSKLGRKVLFDCLNECMETRCKEMYVGTCSSRVGLSPRKDWLVEELYEEISGWKDMSDWMLDDLVDKDMSTRVGRWVDFDIEAFEEGVEIEKAILNSLVNELISELMVI